MEGLERKRESGVAKIVGTSPEDEERWLEYFKHQLDTREPAPFERPKTPEELELVNAMTPLLIEFAERYGADPVFVTPDQIHVIEVDALPEEARERIAKADEHGGYYPEDQAIVIFTDQNLLRTAQTVAHELLHLWSFTSFTRCGEEVVLRRSGFSIFPREGGSIAFDVLDEAVIEELTRRFDEECFGKLAVLAHDLDRREEVRRRYPDKAAEIASVVTRTETDWVERAIPTGYGYRSARDRLKDLIEDIVARCGEECGAPEAVFRRITEAVFKGRLLPLARLVERAYGPGAFRKLGEDTGQTPPRRSR